MMIEELSNIQARIQEIQSRLAALNSQPAAQSVTPTENDASGQSFGATLERAGQEGNTALPGSLSGVQVPPASLGPLPPMPLSLGTTTLAPLQKTENTGTSAYEDLIQSYAAKNGLSPTLVRAVIQTESGGNPRAVSPAGAMGLMQLMPSDAKDAGISDAFDPVQNIAAGTKQLAGLMTQYHGDLDLVLAGYNAGSGNVRKYGGVPPFTETQNYIRKVRSAMERDDS